MSKGCDVGQCIGIFACSFGAGKTSLEHILFPAIPKHTTPHKTLTSTGHVASESDRERARVQAAGRGRPDMNVFAHPIDL
jgi:hypothetical protein